MTGHLDQMSQIAMEMTQRGTSNYMKEVVDSKEKDKEDKRDFGFSEAVHGNNASLTSGCGAADEPANSRRATEWM